MRSEPIAPMPDLLKDIDTTDVPPEKIPFIMVAMVNQMRVLCDCFNTMQERQAADHDCLLLFRVSKCGFDWLKDPNNLKALASMVILIWVICIIFMGSADQISRMFSHYVFHYP